jgi:ABC-2 type transport system permease protein
MSLLIVFFRVIFTHTQRIGDWNEHAYLFFLGTFITLNASVNCLFINGLTHFSEVVRTGELDFVLLKPADEQFLLSCQRFDWTLLPQVLFGLATSLFATLQSEATIPVTTIFIYLLLLVAGVAVLYSLLLILAAVSVWTIRHHELYELWFCLLQFANYPKDIFKGQFVGACLSFVLTFVFPILLAVNVPAGFGAALLSGWQPIVFLGIAAIVTLSTSRRFFRFALRSYRSAST